MSFDELNMINDYISITNVLRVGNQGRGFIIPPETIRVLKKQYKYFRSWGTTRNMRGTLEGYCITYPAISATALGPTALLTYWKF